MIMSELKVSEKFYRGYQFLIRVIQSCKTMDQFKSARKLSWVFIDNNLSWNEYYYEYLKLIASELDNKRTQLFNPHSEIQ